MTTCAISSLRSASSFSEGEEIHRYASHIYAGFAGWLLAWEEEEEDPNLLSIDGAHDRIRGF